PLLEHLAEFDLVLVMSVEPGFGAQKFMPEVLDKVRALRARIDAEGLETLIEIDGGIGPETAAEAAAAGVDVYVAGSSVFGKETATRRSARSARPRRPTLVPNSPQRGPQPAKQGTSS